jgi:murein DD-endopeptidase MepM/ murein hydrolase activator NlpD
MVEAVSWRGVVIAAVATLVASLAPALSSTSPAAVAADRFYTPNTTRYYSPWYEGRHRIMIPFGCTRAPYYAPDPRCKNNRGFHHGIDLAMACGTRLFSNVRGRVLLPTSAGALGSAYGSTAFRIRHDNRDYVFGHVRRALVSPGDRVKRGQLIARAGKRGAPDGCHLHFEVRPKAGGYTSALRPWGYLHPTREP